MDFTCGVVDFSHRSIFNSTQDIWLKGIKALLVHRNVCHLRRYSWILALSSASSVFQHFFFIDLALIIILSLADFFLGTCLLQVLLSVAYLVDGLLLVPSNLESAFRTALEQVVVITSKDLVRLVVWSATDLNHDLVSLIAREPQSQPWRQVIFVEHEGLEVLQKLVSPLVVGS